MPPLFEHPLTVAAEHIDELGHAGNYQFVKWMQDAAIAHSTANGWPPGRYRELGAGWVVRSHRITYLKPAHEGDRLTVRTWVSSAGRVTSQRRYDFLDTAGDRIASAETTWAFVTLTELKPTRIPIEVSSCFEVVGTR